MSDEILQQFEAVKDDKAKTRELSPCFQRI